MTTRDVSTTGVTGPLKVNGNVIIPTGSVGIGTASPGRALDVGGAGGGTVVGIRGGIYNQLNISRQANDGLGLIIGQSDGVSGGYHNTTSGSNNPAVIVNVQNDALHFGTSNLLRATIDHNGNVGIGTANPVDKLQVAGNTSVASDASDSPAAKTVTIGDSSRSGTDSNVAGASGTIRSGIGTGNATGSSLIFQTPTAGASGTGAQTSTTRLTLTALAATFVPPVVHSLPENLKSYTVATLPAGTQGDHAYVTDATAPTYNGALTGGGSVVVPVFKNASAWVSI